MIKTQGKALNPPERRSTDAQRCAFMFFKIIIKIIGLVERRLTDVLVSSNFNLSKTIFKYPQHQSQSMMAN